LYYFCGNGKEDFLCIGTDRKLAKELRRQKKMDNKLEEKKKEYLDSIPEEVTEEVEETAEPVIEKTEEEEDKEIEQYSTEDLKGFELGEDEISEEHEEFVQLETKIAKNILVRLETLSNKDSFQLEEFLVLYGAYRFFVSDIEE